MIVDISLKGRKAIWYGEETEVYAANSLEQIEDYFREGLDTDDLIDERRNVISKDWRYWWRPIASEKEYKRGRFITKGMPVKSARTGVIIKEFERLPLICGVYGDKSKIVQVATSYN